MSIVERLTNEHLKSETKYRTEFY